MSKRERDEKEDDGGVEKRMKMSWASKAQEMLEIMKETKENLKKMKEFLQSEFEKECDLKSMSRGETYFRHTHEASNWKLSLN